MDKETLEQYQDLIQEKIDLQKRIAKVKNEIDLIHREGAVADSVTCGKKGKKPLGTVIIHGFPVNELEQKERTLNFRKVRLHMLECKIDSTLNEIEEYISSVSKSRTRMIIQKKYIDGLSYFDIAKQYGVSEDAIKKTINRLLKDKI